MEKAEEKSWLKARQTGITGTDAPAILGEHPNKSPLDVWISKFEDPGDKTVDPALAERWRLGHLFEKPVAMAYAERTGKRFEPAGFRRHPEKEWLIGTPDFLIQNEKKGLEIKTANSYMARFFGDGGSDEIPVHYLLQCAHYMAVLDYPAWDLAVVFPDFSLKIFNLYRDVELEAMMLEAEERFWLQHIVPKEAPPVDGSMACRQYLMKKYPDAGKTLRPATQEEAKIIHDYQTLQESLKEIEAQKKYLENQIIEAIGPDLGLAFGDSKITFNMVKGRKKTDWEALCIANDISQEEIEMHTSRGKSYRRLLATFK